MQKDVRLAFLKKIHEEKNISLWQFLMLQRKKSVDNIIRENFEYDGTALNSLLRLLHMNYALFFFLPLK